MAKRAAIMCIGAVLLVAITMLAPIVPIRFVLKDELPVVEAKGPINTNDVHQIVTQARGGKFVNLIQIYRGTVNAPFTYVSVINPEDISDAGSVEDRSDVVVGYGIGYRVYLKRKSNGWKVVGMVDWIV